MAFVAVKLQAFLPWHAVMSGAVMFPLQLVLHWLHPRPVVPPVYVAQVLGNPSAGAGLQQFGLPLVVPQGPAPPVQLHTPECNFSANIHALVIACAKTQESLRHAGVCSGNW